jgi:hypothetical protein
LSASSEKNHLLSKGKEYHAPFLTVKQASNLTIFENKLDRFSLKRLVLITRDSARGGASRPVTGAVFKIVCEIVRAILGWFDSDTPPPILKNQR